MVASLLLKFSIPAKTLHSILVAIASLIALLSILMLAFKGDAWSLFEATTDGGRSIAATHVPTEEPNGQLWLAIYPYHLYKEAVKPALAAAGLSLAVSLLVCLIIAIVYQKGPIQVRVFQVAFLVALPAFS